jgi:hypothetical protein
MGHLAVGVPAGEERLPSVGSRFCQGWLTGAANGSASTTVNTGAAVLARAVGGPATGDPAGPSHGPALRGGAVAMGMKTPP